jgi:DUF1680 family protein
VRSAPPGACGLGVRVPEWSRDARFTVNGSQVAPDPADRGYLVIRRHWMPGDVMRCDLNVTPRLTFPGRRIDALRGTAAVQRGPLVYCFEQADQPGGASVEDLALGDADLAGSDGDLPAIGRTVTVQSRALHLDPAGQHGLPYFSQPDHGTAAGGRVTAVAIPYFQWDNRDGRAMRVWMPWIPAATSPDGDGPLAGQSRP